MLDALQGAQFSTTIDLKNGFFHVSLDKDAKRKIAATQEENRRNFNKRRRSAKQYLRGNLVAIKRTQFGPGLKLGGKLLSPYRVSRTMRNDRYRVEKVGEHEGPAHTSTTADFMKPWVLNAEDDASDDSETEDHIWGQMLLQDGRMYYRGQKA